MSKSSVQEITRARVSEFTDPPSQVVADFLEGALRRKLHALKNDKEPVSICGEIDWLEWLLIGVDPLEEHIQTVDYEEAVG